MKTISRTLLFSTILLLCLTTGIARSQTVPYTISLYYPSNNQAFGAPTNIYIHARVTDSNVIQTVQFFAGIPTSAP